MNTSEWGLVLSIVTVLVVGLLGYAVKARDKAHDELRKDFDEERKGHSTKIESIYQRIIDDASKRHTEEMSATNRMHAMEMAMVKLEGEVKLSNNQSSNIVEDVRDIKANMVPRGEWTERMDRMEDKQDKEMDELKKQMRSPSAYRYGTPATGTKPPSRG